MRTDSRERLLHQHRSTIRFLSLGMKENAGSVVSPGTRLEVGVMVVSVARKLTSRLLCARPMRAAGAPAGTKTPSLSLLPPGGRGSGRGCVTRQATLWA